MERVQHIRQCLTSKQFRQVQGFTLNCVGLWNHNGLWAGLQFPCCARASRPLPRSPAATPSAVSLGLAVYTPLAWDRKQKGDSRDWRASISKGRLKNDVMSVAVRPWPVRNRRERLLVKFCGGDKGKKRSTTLVNYIHRALKYKHWQLEIYL